MDGKRRTIEIDEDVAVALEQRAAERGETLDEFLYDVGGRHETSEVILPPEELAELNARIAEWERDRLGYDAEEVFDWLRSRVAGLDAPDPRLRRF